MPSKSKDKLLTFDDDSPLFVKKKTKPKAKPKKKAAKVKKDLTDLDFLQKPRKKKVVKKVLNKNIPKYVIRSPSDCKHILPAFKKTLAAKWKTLDKSNSIQVAELVNYLRGVANVVKQSRPKEYEELRVLMKVAHPD